MLKCITEKVIFWTTVLYYGLLVLSDILRLIYRVGFGKAFSWQPPTRPACLDDTDLGTSGYLHLKDIRIHYVASGPEDKPLMLFLHGFPEFWFSWRYQIKEFQKDYRVVAIDMRGYGDSDKPRGIYHYTVEKLTSDVKQIIPALGYKSCILFGHDWGGVVAWTLSRQYPEIVDKLIIMNCPPLPILKDIYPKEPLQRQMSWYISFFQLPCLPELFFKINNYGAIAHVFNKRRARYAFSETCSMSQEEVDAYKYTFSHAGAMTPPLNYYRAIFPLGNETLDIDYPMPVLVVWGLQDLCLVPANADAIEKANSKITVKRVPEAGHFVQMESPERVNQIVREWLAEERKP